MNISIVKAEVQNPALREIIEATLKTVEDVRTEKSKYMKGEVELDGYKLATQIIALDIMKRRLPINPMIEDKRHASLLITRPVKKRPRGSGLV